MDVVENNHHNVEVGYRRLLVQKASVLILRILLHLKMTKVGGVDRMGNSYILVLVLEQSEEGHTVGHIHIPMDQNHDGNQDTALSEVEGFLQRTIYHLEEFQLLQATNYGDIH